MSTIQKLLPPKTTTHEEYGLQLNPQAIVSSGRMLPLPDVQYRGSVQHPSRGQWKIGNFLRPCDLGTVRVLNMERRLRPEVAQQAMEKMKGMLKEKGMTWKNWEDAIKFIEGDQDLEGQIKKSGPPVSLIFVFTRGDSDPAYGWFKFLFIVFFLLSFLNPTSRCFRLKLATFAADLKRIFEVAFGAVVQCLGALWNSLLSFPSIIVVTEWLTLFFFLNSC
jgi:hypothetical protein